MERYGFPDDPREWTLSDREKGNGGNSEPTLPVKQCSVCFFCSRPSPTCPNCGHTHPVKPRDIEEVEGELQEVKRKEERQKQGRAQTLDDLIALGKSKGYKNPRAWAMHVYKGRRK